MEKEYDSKKHSESKKEKMSVGKKLKKNPWILSTLIFGIIAIIFLIGSFSTTGQVSKDIVGQEFVEFINSQSSSKIELVSSENQGVNLYKFTVSSQGQEVPVYVTQDGKYYVPQIFPIADSQETSEPSDQDQVKDIPKSDKPIVELFIMTHCPYGTQAEKGFIPFMETIGNELDAKIRFVHYFMHEGENQEPEETPRQLCIREEQPDKFLTYLRYFLEEGDYEYALENANIDVEAIEECISSGRAEEYYVEDSALSEGYGVKGSPTLVINGEIVSSGRSPADYLNTACQAFNDAPEVCSEELDSTSPSPMWGWDASGQDTTAQC